MCSMQASNAVRTAFSLPFGARSRLDVRSKRAILQKELESVLNCFLFAATIEQLYWKHVDVIPRVVDTKVAA